MRVHNLYIADTGDRDDLTPSFLDLLDRRPEFYCRIVGNEPRKAVARGECMLRIAMASAHAVIVLLGRSGMAPRALDDELRLARVGYSRSLPVIAVLAPEATEAEARKVAADRIVGWDGDAVVAAIEECCRTPGPRRGRRAAGVPAATCAF